MLRWKPSFKIFQTVMIRQRIWSPGGRGLFSLYINIENVKNRHVRKRWIDVNIIWQECFFDEPLPRFFKPSWFVNNPGSQGDGWGDGGWGGKGGGGGQGLFSLYLYIEHFKNLLDRNHWTDFNIIWQKCFFGDRLPRLFKLSLSITMAARGLAYFPYISI